MIKPIREYRISAPANFEDPATGGEQSATAQGAPGNGASGGQQGFGDETVDLATFCSGWQMIAEGILRKYDREITICCGGADEPCCGSSTARSLIKAQFDNLCPSNLEAEPTPWQQMTMDNPYIAQLEMEDELMKCLNPCFDQLQQGKM